MKVKGVWLENVGKLKPGQWVNVWDVDIFGDCTYYATCQVKDINLPDENDDYALEPIEDEGEA